MANKRAAADAPPADKRVCFMQCFSCEKRFSAPEKMCSVCHRGCCPDCDNTNDSNGNKPDFATCDECKVDVCINCTHDWSGWQWAVRDDLFDWDDEEDHRTEQVRTTTCAYHTLERALNGAVIFYTSGNNGAPKATRTKLADKIRLLLQSEEFLEEGRHLDKNNKK